MKRFLDTRNNFGTIWSARTANFTVYLILERSYEKYDGDDENGEIQAELDSGEMVMFDSKLVVETDINGESIEIGVDYLGASVYRDGETAKFIHDGYFADMLNLACANAREYLASVPRLRSI